MKIREERKRGKLLLTSIRCARPFCLSTRFGSNKSQAEQFISASTRALSRVACRRQDTRGLEDQNEELRGCVVAVVPSTKLN